MNSWLPDLLAVLALGLLVAGVYVLLGVGVALLTVGVGVAYIAWRLGASS